MVKFTIDEIRYVYALNESIVGYGERSLSIVGVCLGGEGRGWANGIGMPPS